MNWIPPVGSRTDVLAGIVATKRREVGLLTGRSGELRARARDAPEPRDFAGALGRSGSVTLIAEVKRRSPGAGEIRPALDPAELARAYEKAGAGALSILTDREYFGGSLEDLSRARAAVSLPILRKDFLIAEAQVWEARAAGADAILLIASILDDRPLRELRLLAESLGMTALVEVHDAAELARAINAGTKVLGINNRDLRTFRTTLDTTLGLLGSVPSSVPLVSESGIHEGAEVARLGRAGVDAVLVGEALLRASDPGEKARQLSGHPRGHRAPGTRSEGEGS